MTPDTGSPRRDKRQKIAAAETHGSAFGRLIGWIDRLPMPAWVFYVLVTAAAVAVALGLLRIAGVPAGSQVGSIYLLGTLLTAYPLAMMHYLRRAAAGSLEAFRPALGRLRAEYPYLQARLTTISGRALWIIVALGIVFTVLSIASNPGSWGFGEPMPLPTMAFALIQGTWVDICVMALLLFLIRQISCIARIHREATNIRLYESGSHRAFSRLTLVAAIGLLIPVYGFALVARSTGSVATNGMSQIDALMLAVFVLLSAVVFVVPLYGMRRRLEDLKKAAIRECDQRFQAAVTRVHARLDAGSLKDLEGLSHAMTSLALERESLHRISTWPWAADTLRRYFSAIALPVFIVLLGRYIARFLGI